MLMNLRTRYAAIILIFFLGCSSIHPVDRSPTAASLLRTSENPASPCMDSVTQSDRSAELQKLLSSDQADRKWAIDLASGIRPTTQVLEAMAENDLVRRKRVGEIFGEGCVKGILDYKAASLIYQHGNVPDHFFQAYIWAQKAVNLGSKEEMSEVAMAIDRFLVESGHKELFGTQARQISPSKCYCIQPIEESFPEELRDRYRGGLNHAYTGLQYLKKLNSASSGCPEAYCDTSLLSSPKGSVPGFW